MGLTKREKKKSNETFNAKLKKIKTKQLKMKKNKRERELCIHAYPRYDGTLP